MTFLQEYRASRQNGRSDPDEAQAAVVRDWLTSRPDAMFEDLREHEPTFLAGRLAFVTRYSDVVDVLARNDVFSVRPYGEPMMRINRGPNFLLGMDDGPEYQQQLSLLRRAFRRDDVDRIREIVGRHTSQVLDRALGDGRLELTDGFGRLIPTLFVADFFGVPGPDPETLMTWARVIFTDGFANTLRDPIVSTRAMKASEEFHSHLEGLIARVREDRSHGAAPRDDVIGRLVAMAEAGEPGLSDARIRDNLLWCIAGMIDNINTGVCNVMDCLLGDPGISQRAVDAAAAQDTELLRRFVREALRFRPPAPVATRLSVREYTLSRGTPHERRIPAETLTFMGIGAAMMDHTAIESPRTFRLDRPPEAYLHFGGSVHHCLGTHIADSHLTEMVGSLLKLNGIRRARGSAGRLLYAGLFPKKFVVQFDGPGASA